MIPLPIKGHTTPMLSDDLRIRKESGHRQRINLRDGLKKQEPGEISGILVMVRALHISQRASQRWETVRTCHSRQGRPPFPNTSPF